MSNVVDYDKALELMEVTKGIGDFPVTVHLPADLIPTEAGGGLWDFEPTVKLGRKMVEESFAAMDRAERRRNRRAFAKAEDGASDAMRYWMAMEIVFAALLIKHGVPLEGHSMIKLKK